MSDMKSNPSLAYIKEGHFLNKIILGLILVDAVSYLFSGFLFKVMAVILLKVITLKIFWKKLGCGETLEKKKWVKKLVFYMMYTEIKKKSKSINQTLALLTKSLLNIPIADNEDEVTSYNDLMHHHKEKWPYMMKVKDTMTSRVTVSGKTVHCISSYSYLDLCNDSRLQEAAFAAAKKYSTGNHGPRMLCGNLEILETLEQRIAKFFKRDAALVFSSGYLACLSVIAGIGRAGDLILMDKLSHASLRAGAKLCNGKVVNFKHNDFKDAEKQIKSHKHNRVIMVIEGVYSMDGDVGFLDQARVLCDKYNGILILDEAHSIGVIGKTGKGTEELYDYKYKADIICGTFTKAIASVGGYIACDQRLRDFYTFYGPGVVFSAPLSAYHCGAADKAFEIIENEPEITETTQKNAEYLRNKFRENNFNIGHTISCVIPVIFNDPIQCFRMHAWLLENGYFTAIVMAPACPVTAPRFRICATYGMTTKEMDGIIDAFKRVREAIPENKELTEILGNI